MTFANPAWWALLAVAVPLVLLFHARRRRDLTVASLLVWRRLPATTGAAPQPRRFPWRDPRLWAQLLAVVAAVAALARPTLGAAAEPVHWIVVVDASSSMNASDVPPSRFAAAVAAIEARWGSPQGRDRVSVVRAGPTASIVASRWPTGGELATAVAALPPADGAPDWLGAARRVAALAGDGPFRVVAFTDAYGAAAARAALDAVARPEGGDGSADVLVLGDALVNVGVGDVRAAPRGARPDQWTVTGRVATVGFAADETVRVVVGYRPFGGGAFLPWGGADVTLERDGSGAFEVPLDLPGTGELEVRGPAGDRLPGDDRAVLALRPEPVRIALVGPPDPALVRALAAIGGVEVFAADTLPDAADAPFFDLTIVTDPAAAGVPTTSTLWLGAVPEGAAEGGPLVAPLPVLEAGAHALVADVDPGAIALRRAQPLRLLDGAAPLLTAGEAVLGWARTTTAGRQVVLGFGLGDGDWAAQLSFPAFLAAVVDWAAPRAWSHDHGGCTVGAACPWPRAAFAGGWSLAGPDGARVVVPPAPRPTPGDPLAEAVWDEAWFDAGYRPERAGRYALERADGGYGLPVAAAPVGGAPAEGAGGAVPGAARPARDAGRGFAVAALVLLALDAALAAVARRAPSRRRSWRPAAWTAVAAAAWAAALGGVPLPAPENAGAVAWVRFLGGGAAVQDPGLAPGGWRSDVVAVRPAGAAASDGATRAGADGGAVAPDVPLAVEAALATPYGGGARRVVVEADAAATVAASDWVALAGRAAAAGVVLDVVPPSASATVAAGVDDAWTDLRVPTGVRAGAPFRLTARVAVPEGRGWTWRAELLAAPFAAGAPADRPTVAPTALAETAGVGPDDAVVELRAGEPGELRYRLTLTDADGGPLASTTVAVAVGPRVSVLVVAGDDAQGARLGAALAAQAIDARRTTPFRMPGSVDALAAYDAVLLVNVSASELFSAYQENLEAYVRERGGGLLVFGGPSAYGPGGYFRTPLEDLSPLSAQITEDAPEVALAFVLDRSGSMNAAVGPTTRMDVAKLATLGALELLGERSQAALIVFDAEAQVLLPFRSVQDVGAFERALASVRAAGGTSIYPGLVQALELMRATDAATRHVVVMTDGLSQEADFASVLADLRGLGIATSFVGVGDAADRRQLTTLANLSGGALHFALDFRALPSLLAQEALMLSATPIEERPTRAVPTGRAPGPLLDGVDVGALPLLGGYVRTTPKDEAQVHLAEPQEDDPLLASWRYGLGRVAAFASEADGPWAAAWTDADGYGRLWSQTVRWLAERPVRAPGSLQLAAVGRVLDVAVELEPAPGTGSAPVLVELLAADRRLASAPLDVPAGAARGVARFEIADGFAGDLTVRVAAAPAAGLPRALEATVAWPSVLAASPRAGVVALERLASATGGGVRAADALAWPEPARAFAWRPWVEAWLLLGLVAFLVALATGYGAWAAWTAALRRGR